jgi:hypothetical protein
MPGVSGKKPVAFATAAISTIVLVPSTKEASIFGFIRFCSASSATDSGVAETAIFARTAPTVTSVSTLSMTTCLPPWMAS